MTDPTPLDDEQALARRLKKEAAETWPNFSDGLHNRITDALAEESPRSSASSQDRPLGRGRRLALVVAAAAACLLGVAVLSWWSQLTGNPTDNVGAKPSVAVPELPPAPDPSVLATAPVDVLNEVEESLDWLVASTEEERRWAHLDRDAQLVVGLVTAQLPFGLLAEEEEADL